MPRLLQISNIAFIYLSNDLYKTKSSSSSCQPKWTRSITIEEPVWQSYQPEKLGAPIPGAPIPGAFSHFFNYVYSNCFVKETFNHLGKLKCSIQNLAYNLISHIIKRSQPNFARAQKNMDPLYMYQIKTYISRYTL